MPHVHGERVSRPSTLPGILDALNHLHARVPLGDAVLVPRQGRKAKALLEKYRKQWWQKRKGLWTMIKEEAAKQEAALVDNAAANKAADADAALQELGDDLVSFGYLTTTVTVWDRDPRRARAARCQRVKQVIQSRGFTVKDETLNATSRMARGPARSCLRQRPPADRQLDEPGAPDAPLERCGRATRTTSTSRGVRCVGRRTCYCSTTGVDAVSPAPQRRRRRAHAHPRAHRERQVDAARACSPSVAQVPARPGHRLRQGPVARAPRRSPSAGPATSPATSRRRWRFQPLAGIDQPAERIWAVARSSQTLLAAQGVEVDHRTQAAHRRDAREPRGRAAPAADAHAARDAARIAAASAPGRASALHARGQLRPDLRRRPRRRRRPALLDDDRDGAPDGPGPGRRPSGARVPLSPCRRPVRRAPDAAHPRRGLALSRPRGLRARAFRAGSRRCARRTSTSSSRRRRSPTRRASPSCSRPSSRPATRRSSFPTRRR